MTVTVTLVSEVSIAAASGYAAEGADAVFRLTRAGSALKALTVPVTVEETGAMLGADVPANATFAAGVRETELRVPTAAGRGLGERQPGHDAPRVGFGLAARAGCGGGVADGARRRRGAVGVGGGRDDLVGRHDGGGVRAAVDRRGDGGPVLEPDGPGGLRAKRLWYDPTERKLRIGFDDGLDDAELLTLHMGGVSVGFPANSGGDSSFTLENVDVSWSDGETLAVRVSKPSAVALSTDATLASLSADGATLSPAFDAGCWSIGRSRVRKRRR